MFILIFGCILFDREAVEALNILCWLTLAFAAVTDRVGGRVVRIVPVLVALLIVLASAGAAAWFAGDFSVAADAFVKYQVGVIWLAVLWLAAPVILRGWWGGGAADGPASHPYPEFREGLANCGCPGRWIATLIIILLLFAFHATISAAAAMFPEESMDQLGAEILAYAGLFIIIVRSGWCLTSGWWRIGTRGVWLLAVVACIGMAAVPVVSLLSPTVAVTLFNYGFFRIDEYAPDTWRLQFLFQHHNRAGFFAAGAIFLCIAGAWGGRWWRIFGIAGAICAAGALPFTLTRGAMIAAAAGMALFAVGTVIRYRRARWVVLAFAIVALPVLWFAIPDSYQQHIAKITNPANYTEGAGGSIGARLVMWEGALVMIEQRPALGFGYGAEGFEDAARAAHPAKPVYFEGASHAHSIWLETAAEVGLPGFILLAVFTALRVGGLAGAWWRGRRSYRLAWLLLAWLSLECVIQIYALANYPLRRNLGVLTYGIWAGSVVLVMMAGREEGER